MKITVSNNVSREYASAEELDEMSNKQIIELIHEDLAFFFCGADWKIERAAPATKPLDAELEELQRDVRIWRNGYEQEIAFNDGSGRKELEQQVEELKKALAVRNQDYAEHLKRCTMDMAVWERQLAEMRDALEGAIMFVPQGHHLHQRAERVLAEQKG